MGDRPGVQGEASSLETFDLAAKRRSGARVFRFDVCSHHAAFLTDTPSSLVEEHMVVALRVFASRLLDEGRIEFSRRDACRTGGFHWNEEHDDPSTDICRSVLLVCTRCQGVCDWLG
jgi:hypothetical protein